MTPDLLKSPKRREIENLWPDLTWHYGLGFTELCHMPRWAVELYAEELPRLVASQQMRNIESSSFADLDESARDGIMRRLERSLPEPEPVVRTFEEMATMAAISGIGVIKEPKPEEVTDA